MTLPVIGVDTFSLSSSSAYKESYFPKKILKVEVGVNTSLLLSLLLLLSMMTLINGFTCPPTIYFKFVTKCDKCYYKVRQVLQSVTILLQSATIITNCDRADRSVGELNAGKYHAMQDQLAFLKLIEGTKFILILEIFPSNGKNVWAWKTQTKRCYFD